MLLTGVAVSIARCGREKEINAQVMAAKEEQTRQELRMQQEYGCDIYGQYEYPYMTFWPRITTDSGEHRKIYGPMGCMSTNTTEPFWKGRRN